MEAVPAVGVTKPANMRMVVRLAGAVGAEKAQHLPRGHLEAHIVNGDE